MCSPVNRSTVTLSSPDLRMFILPSSDASRRRLSRIMLPRIKERLQYSTPRLIMHIAFHWRVKRKTLYCNASDREGGNRRCALFSAGKVWRKKPIQSNGSSKFPKLHRFTFLGSFVEPAWMPLSAFIDQAVQNLWGLHTDILTYWRRNKSSLKTRRFGENSMFEIGRI